MKQLYLLMALLCLTASIHAQQAGRIRISLIGATCNQETWDNALNSDGWGDEVFFNFNCTLTAADGTNKFNYTKRSATYGDNGGPFGNRIRVGSAGNSGGLKAGDSFTCNELIGEYDIDATDVLSILPAVWEWDGGGGDPAGSFNSKYAQFTSAGPSFGTKINDFVNKVNPNIGAVTSVIFRPDLAVVQQFSGLFKDLFGVAGDRPIGRDGNGSFEPQLVALNARYIQSLMNANFGYGQGVLAINYDENQLNNTREHGNYTLLLKIEWVPKAGAVPPARPINPALQKRAQDTKSNLIP
jgi:hypothetical protein